MLLFKLTLKDENSVLFHDDMKYDTPLSLVDNVEYACMLCLGN